jgi:hypothetical protein
LTTPQSDGFNIMIPNYRPEPDALGGAYENPTIKKLS